MLNKFVAVLTMLCFLISSVFAGTLHAIASPVQVSPTVTPLQTEPFVPASFGTVTAEKYFGSKQVVINIQDLHCHPELQMNVSRIIESLDKKYHLANVFVEGGYGTVDTSPLCRIADTDMKMTIIRGLLEQGKLTGSEYYSITANRPDLLKGIEDPALHKSNIIRLGQILERKERFEKTLVQLSSDLERMKAKYFNARNRKLENIIQKYRKGDIDPVKYYALLNKYVDAIHRNPENFNSLSSLDMRDYPSITAYIDALHSVKLLDNRQIPNDLQHFVTLIKSNVSYREYATLREKTRNFTDTDVLCDSLAQISQAHSLPIPSALASLVTYNEIKKRVNPLQLVEEERKLVSEIRVSLSGDVSEMEVSFLADFFSCFKDYLLNKLSVNDYVFFSEKFNAFQLTWGKYTYKNHIGDLAADFPLLDAYYRVNMQRNDSFINTIFPALLCSNTEPSPISVADEDTAIRETLSNGGQPIIIVAGGFHTEGLTKLLEKRKISYLTITPIVTDNTRSSDKAYAEFAREQAHILSNALALGSALQSPKLSIFMGEAIEYILKQNNIELTDKYLARIQSVFHDALGSEPGIVVTKRLGSGKISQAVLTLENGVQLTLQGTDKGLIRGVSFDFSNLMSKTSAPIIHVSIGELFKTLKLETKLSQDILGSIVVLPLDGYNLLKWFMVFSESNNIDMSDMGDGLLPKIARNPLFADTIDGLRSEDVANWPEWAQIIIDEHARRIKSLEETVRRSQLLKIFLSADILGIASTFGSPLIIPSNGPASSKRGILATLFKFVFEKHTTTRVGREESTGELEHRSPMGAIFREMIAVSFKNLGSFRLQRYATSSQPKVTVSSRTNTVRSLISVLDDAKFRGVRHIVLESDRILLDPDTLRNRKRERILEESPLDFLVPGILEFIKEAKARNIQLSIVSASDESRKKIFDKLALTNYFNNIYFEGNDSRKIDRIVSLINENSHSNGDIAYMDHAVDVIRRLKGRLEEKAILVGVQETKSSISDLQAQADIIITGMMPQKKGPENTLEEEARRSGIRAIGNVPISRGEDFQREFRIPERILDAVRRGQNSVLAIGGPTGTGKSTLSGALQQGNGYTLLHLAADRFNFSRDAARGRDRTDPSKLYPYDHQDQNMLIEAIANLKNKKVAVIPFWNMASGQRLYIDPSRIDRYRSKETVLEMPGYQLAEADQDDDIVNGLPLMTQESKIYIDKETGEVLEGAPPQQGALIVFDWDIAGSFNSAWNLFDYTIFVWSSRTARLRAMFFAWAHSERYPGEDWLQFYTRIITNYFHRRDIAAFRGLRTASEIVISENENKMLEEYAYTATWGETTAERTVARRLIIERGLWSGLVPVSTFDLYRQMAAGKIKGVTIPAIEVRTNTMEQMRHIFKEMKSRDIKLVLLELPFRERGSGDQMPELYQTLAYAAAMLEGYRGQIALQANQLWMDTIGFEFHPQRTRKWLHKAIRAAVTHGHYSINLDNSTLFQPAPRIVNPDDMDYADGEELYRWKEKRKHSEEFLNTWRGVLGEEKFAAIRAKVKDALNEDDFYSAVIADISQKLSVEPRNSPKRKDFEILLRDIKAFSARIHDGREIDNLVDELLVSQVLNAQETAISTIFIRGVEPKGITVAVGGEIDRLSTLNSEPGGFVAFMELYNAMLQLMTESIKSGILKRDETKSLYKVFDSLTPKDDIDTRSSEEILGLVKRVRDNTFWPDSILRTIRRKGEIPGLSTLVVRTDQGGYVDFTTMPAMVELARRYGMVIVQERAGNEPIEKYSESGVGELHLSKAYAQAAYDELKSLPKGSEGHTLADRIEFDALERTTSIQTPDGVSLYEGIARKVVELQDFISALQFESPGFLSFHSDIWTAINDIFNHLVSDTFDSLFGPSPETRPEPIESAPAGALTLYKDLIKTPRAATTEALALDKDPSVIKALRAATAWLPQIAGKKSVEQKRKALGESFLSYLRTLQHERFYKSRIEEYVAIWIKTINPPGAFFRQVEFRRGPLSHSSYGYNYLLEIDGFTLRYFVDDISSTVTWLNRSSTIGPNSTDVDEPRPPASPAPWVPEVGQAIALQSPEDKGTPEGLRGRTGKALRRALRRAFRGTGSGFLNAMELTLAISALGVISLSEEIGGRKSKSVPPEVHDEPVQRDQSPEEDPYQTALQASMAYLPKITASAGEISDNERRAAVRDSFITFVQTMLDAGTHRVNFNPSAGKSLVDEWMAAMMKAAYAGGAGVLQLSYKEIYSTITDDNLIAEYYVLEINKFPLVFVIEGEKIKFIKTSPKKTLRILQGKHSELTLQNEPYIYKISLNPDLFFKDLPKERQKIDYGDETSSRYKPKTRHIVLGSDEILLDVTTLTNPERNRILEQSPVDFLVPGVIEFIKEARSRNITL
ncbi:MAG: hypothetical protein ABSH12_07215, partial [Endomicrobiales bacterium]